VGFSAFYRMGSPCVSLFAKDLSLVAPTDLKGSANRKGASATWPRPYEEYCTHLSIRFSFLQSQSALLAISVLISKLQSTLLHTPHMSFAPMGRSQTKSLFRYEAAELAALITSAAWTNKAMYVSGGQGTCSERDDQRVNHPFHERVDCRKRCDGEGERDDARIDDPQVGRTVHFKVRRDDT
jgi:hypothetical protein